MLLYLFTIDLGFIRPLKMFLFQQTKRKLDDAGKRLGYLYDKLREQTVGTAYTFIVSLRLISLSI